MTGNTTAPSGRRMAYDPKVERSEFMSRSESRKLLLMGAALLLLVAWIVQSGLSGPAGGEGPEGIPVRPGPRPGASALPPPGLRQDSRAVLETLRRVEEERLRAEAEAPADPSAPTTSPGAPEPAAPPAAQPPAAPARSAAAQAFVYDPEVVAQTVDGEIDLVEEPAFYQVLARVHFLSEDEVARAPAELGAFDWTDLHTPEGVAKARGKFLTVRGRFWIPLWQRVLERYPNETGTEVAWVWQGIFRSQNRGFFVTITDKNLEPEIGPEGDEVELTVALLKAFRFKALNGEVMSYPHVIARSIRRVEPPPARDPMNDPMLWGAVGVILVIGLVVFAYAKGSSRGERRFEDWRRKRIYDARKKGLVKVAEGTLKAEHEAAKTGAEAAQAAASEPADAAACGPLKAYPVADAAAQPDAAPPMGAGEAPPPSEGAAPAEHEGAEDGGDRA